MKSKKAPTKQTRAEPVPSFEVFCAEAQLEQRRLDHAIPTATSHSFAYFQWRHAAAAAFKAKYGISPRCEDPSMAGSLPGSSGRTRVRARSPSPSAASSAAPPEEDPLVGATAALLLHTLAEGQVAAAAPAALKRAREEPFPMPQASTEDAEALLAMTELIIRMSLARPTDDTLSPMVRKVRGLVKLFIERGVVHRRRGGYPSIAFLMDLLSLRTIVSSWAQLDGPARGYVLYEMDGFTDRIRCTALTSLQQELASMRATGRDLDVDCVTHLIVALASQVPYDFPRACHDALCDALQQPSLPGPSGQLLLVGEDGEAEDEEQVDDVAEVEAIDMVRTRQPANTKKAAHQPRPVLSVVAPPRTEANAPSSARSATASRGVPCTSKYHKRYATATAHASHLCAFCVVCHMLEILFNGCLTNCTYNHWPTAGKIRYNLRQHPRVKQLALARLEKSERGESLKVGVDIPL